MSLSENSFITCLHAPHGLIGSGVFPVITSNFIFFMFPVIAVVIALRSAQRVSPKEAFSTLTPLCLFPLSSINNAATGNLEYGTYAFSSKRFTSSI